MNILDFDNDENVVLLPPATRTLLKNPLFKEVLDEYQKVIDDFKINRYDIQKKSTVYIIRFSFIVENKHGEIAMNTLETKIGSNYKLSPPLRQDMDSLSTKSTISTALSQFLSNRYDFDPYDFPLHIVEQHLHMIYASKIEYKASSLKKDMEDLIEKLLKNHDDTVYSIEKDNLKNFVKAASKIPSALLKRAENELAIEYLHDR